MNTILIIVGVLAVVVGIAIYLQKTGKIEDKDGDLIPDVIEDKVEKVKAKAKKVAKESKEVINAVKTVVSESKDVIDAVKVTPKTKRKPSTKK